MYSSSNVSLAGFLTLLIVGSAALLGVSPTVLAQDGPTLIDECTTIGESGEYVLTRDITGDGGTCLRIEARDVTIDGQGHTVHDGDVDAADFTGEGIRIDHLTIKDLHVPNGEITYTARDGAIESVTAQRISVIDDITGTIRDSVIAGASSGDDGRPADGAGLYLTDAAVIVENTTIRDNDVGIWTDELAFSLTVRDSEIRDNGVGIHARWELTETTIEDTIVAGNDIGANVYDGQPNLSGIYWGAADGPSSVYENGSTAPEPWADSETGALANGSGDGVTGSIRTGEASVRFDPWLAVPALSDEFAGSPQDLDGDGLYEDVNGDGDVNVGDAQALFAFEDSTTVQEHAALFDFNEDGAVDVGDAQALFAQVTA